MTHIVIGRAAESVPHAWRKASWSGKSWTMGVGITENFTALVEQLLGAPLTTDVTISPRNIDALIGAPPEKLGLPVGRSALILCPIAQPGAAHLSSHWILLISMPDASLFQPVAASEFVEKTLSVQLKEMILTPATIAEFTSAYCRREIWVRPSWSAAELFPAIWPQYVQKSTVAPTRPDGRTPAQLKAEQATRDRNKKHSQASIRAGAAEREAAIKKKFGR